MYSFSYGHVGPRDHAVGIYILVTPWSKVRLTYSLDPVEPDGSELQRIQPALFLFIVKCSPCGDTYYWCIILFNIFFLPVHLPCAKTISYLSYTDVQIYVIYTSRRYICHVPNYYYSMYTFKYLLPCKIQITDYPKTVIITQKIIFFPLIK